jgi:hypothetical protein
MNKVLLISDYAPTESNSGGIVMAQQLYFLRQFYNVDILVYSSEERTYDALSMESGQIYHRIKLGERVLRVRSNKIKRILEYLFSVTILKLWLKLEKKYLRKILKEQKYDEILISVQGLFMAKLLCDVNFPKDSVILQYWDPDHWWAEQHNFSKQLSKEINQVHVLMERADYTSKIFVPSEGMANAICERSGIENSKLRVLYPADKFPSNKVDPPIVFNQIRKSFSKVIVMAGATYALTEIQLMLEVIEELNLDRPNDEIQLVFIGPDGISLDSRFLNQSKGFVHLLGRLSVAETDACLRVADINFLPYPFWNRVLVEQSFPSKFSKYLGSAQNILIAAPSYSSLSILLKSYSLFEGVVNTLSKTNLKREITLLMENEFYADQQLFKLNLIREELFSQDVFEEKLKSAFKCRNKNYENIEIVNVTITPGRTWVNTFNSSVRNLGFFIENLRNPIHMCVYFMYRLLYLSKVPILVKFLIGNANYQRYRSALRKRIKY